MSIIQKLKGLVRIEVVRVPSPESVDSILSTVNTAVERLKKAKESHAQAAEHHWQQAEASSRAAEVANAESLRSDRIAERLLNLVG